MPVPRPILNLGIVAHVDAGKTTLTERLLFETGVSTHLGRVDHGDTVTDADELERRRGITIRSAVVTFTVGDTKVNLIDTPGHSDFVAEVERALAVLDGAVLVVSAVERVQAQTRVLIRILERLRIPFLVFANKIDRAGAAYDETMTALRAALAGDAIALTRPVGEGSRAAQVRPARGAEFLEELVERLADHDDRLLQVFVDDRRTTTEAEALAALARLTATGALHPVYFGSALEGTGVPDVLIGLGRFLRSAEQHDGDPLRATVFKIERDPAGSKVAVARLFAGTLAARDHVEHHHRSPSGAHVALPARPTSVRTLVHGTAAEEGTAAAGEIALVRGLGEVAIGDQLGQRDPARGGRYFAPPGLEAVVLPRDPDQRPALYEALRELSDQDPLIDARLDGLDAELTVSLYGEVQKEVLMERLATDFRVAAEFLPTQTIHVERVSGVGEAVARSDGGNATVGLRIGPAAAGSGLTYAIAVERGWLLPSFHTAIEETLPRELGQGLYGWAVTDCAVTLVQSRYHAPTPPAGYFRALTAQALRAALERAGTTVCAPTSEVEAEFPAAATSRVLHELQAAGATMQQPVLGPVRGRVSGLLATERVQALEQRLPGLTQGEGFLLSRPAGFEPVTGPPPRRTRLRVGG